MSRRVPPVLVAIATLASLAGPARAQAPEERARLDSIRTAYHALIDSLTLGQRERQKITVARANRDSVLLHMELGYLAFRLGELTNVKKHYEDAASEFQWAADLRPAWPYAWYNLGLAELATGEADFILIENIRQMLGVDFLSRAAHAFARAVEADPSFSRGLVDLASTAMRQRIAPRLVVAQGALRLASGTAAGTNPEVLLLWGRVERRLSSNDTALVAFRRYLAAGGDRGTGFVEVARTMALLGRTDSALAAYDSALARRFTDSTRGEVRRDLRWIATPGELVVYDHAPAESAGAWIRGFWGGRDAEDGRRAGERLIEQFARYQYALNNFSLVSRRRAYDPSFAYRDTTQDEVDDRGVIYIRHGEPDQRAQFQAPGVEPNESWLYKRRAPQADLIFHFVARGDVQDYRLVETLADILGSGPAVSLMATMEEQGPLGLMGNLYSSRASFNPLYEMIARGGSTNRSQLLAEERQLGEAMVRIGTTTDSYGLRFAADLYPIISWFAVGDPHFAPELHVVFALPAQRLHAVQGSGAATYPLNLRLVVQDSAKRPLAAVDTVRVFRARGALGEGSYLTEQLVLRVPPGAWTATFVVHELQADAGAAISGVPVEVPRMDAGFSASDLILGRVGSGLVWRRTDEEIPLNPLMRFPRRAVATLYYEVYGLPQGATVETRVRVIRRGSRSIFHRIFGGGGGADLAYSTVTDAPGRARVRQQLSLEDLAPGRYALELQLLEPRSGTRVVRSAPFEIENRQTP
jgi:GWxTD domain-containing protein